MKTYEELKDKTVDVVEYNKDIDKVATITFSDNTKISLHIFRKDEYDLFKKLVKPILEEK